MLKIRITILNRTIIRLWIAAGLLLSSIIVLAGEVKAFQLPAAIGPIQVNVSGTEFKTVRIKSSADGTMQLVRIYIPSSIDQQVPLVVALHTWSGDYRQTQNGTNGVIDECRKRGWAMVFPDFRRDVWAVRLW